MIVHSTDFRSFAHRGLLARILAFAIDARLVQWTFVVAATAQHNASNSRIATVARQTFANRTMIDTVAFSSFAALIAIGRTGRNTLSIDAGVRFRAFRIGCTSDFDALNFRIAVVALLTRTHRLMVFDATFSIRSTIARVTAYVIDARFVTRTIRIGYASSHIQNWFQWLTRSTSTADISFGTHADHRSNW